MRCRHTVADWRRHVIAPEAAAPIYAACRLLVREGEPAGDSRAIACAYWGRQEACPLYEGPARVDRPGPAPTAADVPVGAAMAWPVRGPGERDPVQEALLGLHVASIALLIAAPLLAFVVGRWLWGAAIGLSLAAHAIGALRAWAGR